METCFNTKDKKLIETLKWGISDVSLLPTLRQEDLIFLTSILLFKWVLQLIQKNTFTDQVVLEEPENKELVWHFLTEQKTESSPKFKVKPKSKFKKFHSTWAAYQAQVEAAMNEETEKKEADMKGQREMIEVKEAVTKDEILEEKIEMGTSQMEIVMEIVKEISQVIL